MALPSSPPITLLQIKTEFGGGGEFNSYVRGGAYVPDSAANAGIPTTAAGMRLLQFLGGSAFSPITHTYQTNGTSGTETIPSGATTVVIEVWGPSGSGGHGNNSGVGTIGGSGGSGGYSRSVYTVSGHAGATMSYACGTGATSNANVISGTFTITGMQCPTGGNGGNGTLTVGGGGGGAGPTGTGGNQLNSAGNAGAAGDPTGNGAAGAAVTGIHGTGKPGALGTGINSGSNPGLTGTVVFYYT